MRDGGGQEAPRIKKNTLIHQEKYPKATDGFQTFGFMQCNCFTEQRLYDETAWQAACLVFFFI